jgi:hypothetical protein
VARGDCQIQDSTENPASGAGLAYREAFTTYDADDAVDYLVNAFGLKLAPEAERSSALRLAECHSALQNPAPGRIVFVYRRARDTGYGARDTGCGLRETGLGIRDSGERGATQGTPQPAPAAPRNAQATLHKVAA